MKDSEANVKLIKHVNKRVEEFLDEYQPEQFRTVDELQRAFSAFLRKRDRGHTAPKQADGVISEQVWSEDAYDEHSHTLAFVKMFSNGRLGLMWSPVPFTHPGLPLPDELREMLVQMLRYHADRLEDRSLDAQMRKLLGDMSGAA